MTDQEMNEAVARKLGHELLEHPHTKELKLREIHGDIFYLAGIPDYCHSIELAWQIVRGLQADGYIVEVTEAIRLSRCVIRDKSGSVQAIEEVKAGEAPMAICKAFLKLKEE